MRGPALPEPMIALSLAIYALHDTLVERGVLAPGEVAQTLRRFVSGDPTLMQYVDELAHQFDERPFRVLPNSGLTVIDGGKV